MTRLSSALAVVAFSLLGMPQPANAAILNYFAILDGLTEFPPVVTPGTGFATVTFDTVAHTMAVDVTFQDLIGTTTVAHIHSPTPDPLPLAVSQTAGVATQTPTFSGFPAGVTSGAYNNTFDLTLAASWNPSYITANGGTPATAEAAFLTQIAESRAYLNIHTDFRPGGEIRGFLLPAAVIPEPSTYALMIAGLGFVAWAARRRKLA